MFVSIMLLYKTLQNHREEIFQHLGVQPNYFLCNQQSNQLKLMNISSFS